MKTTIILCLCWGFSILWTIAVLRAAARPAPKPPRRCRRAAARPLTTLNPRLLRV
jgi:hypothetical protein